ncbi:MAG: hypothetical protein ACK5IN_04320 [Microbacterium sp.]|uniref:hypothetical protein n=1 Tax=Microbacterium sp. TaxID=51671 RepID=UPI003A8B063F
MTETPRPHRQRVGDDALVAGTDKTWAQWFALLDAAGAVGWTHTDIAAWLVGEQGVDAWWAQGITVGFEQERGLRLPGQNPDGTFSTTVSKTLSVAQADALRLAVAALTELAGDPASVNTEAKYASARWHLDDGARLEAMAAPTTNGKCRVSLTAANLSGPEAFEGWRPRLKALLEGLATRLAAAGD